MALLAGCRAVQPSKSAAYLRSIGREANAAAEVAREACSNRVQPRSREATAEGLRSGWLATRRHLRAKTLIEIWDTRPAELRFTELVRLPAFRFREGQIRAVNSAPL
jgi:hypothetical protein